MPDEALARRLRLPNRLEARADGFFLDRTSNGKEPTLTLLSRIDVRELAAIFVGGALGALARVALVETSLPAAPLHWPWPTFVANIAGAFLLGYFSTRLQERLPLSAYRRPLLGTGFCGAFTTFSTLQIEILRIYDTGRYGLLACYVVVTLVLGYAATHLATALVRRVNSLA